MLDYNRLKSEKFNLRLSESTRAQLENLAAALDIGMAQVIRLAIRELHARKFPVAPKKTRRPS